MSDLTGMGREQALRAEIALLSHDQNTHLTMIADLQASLAKTVAERDEAQLRAGQFEDLLHWQKDETRIALARAAEAEAEVEDLKARRVKMDELIGEALKYMKRECAECEFSYSAPDVATPNLCRRFSIPGHVHVMTTDMVGNCCGRWERKSPPRHSTAGV